MSARDSWPVVVSARRMRGILSQRWGEIWVRGGRLVDCEAS